MGVIWFISSSWEATHSNKILLEILSSGEAKSLTFIPSDIEPGRVPKKS